MRFWLIVALIPFLLSGCASFRSEESFGPKPALPTAEEVHNYVALHWAERGNAFARRSDRDGQSAKLISVSDVSCSYTYSTPECSYLVVGRFGDGGDVTQPMFSQFERNEFGQLISVIVMWHRRR